MIRFHTRAGFEYAGFDAAGIFFCQALLYPGINDDIRTILRVNGDGPLHLEILHAYAAKFR